MSHLNGEKWRQIPGFDDYEASNLGRIRRALDGRVKKAGDLIAQTGKRYRYVGLCPIGHPRRTIQVHILVAMAFHGLAPSPDHEVAHWDGDGLNNRAENLRWALPVENIADRTRHGRQARFIGEKNVLCLHGRSAAEALMLARKATGESYAKIGARFGSSLCRPSGSAQGGLALKIFPPKPTTPPRRPAVLV